MRLKTLHITIQVKEQYWCTKRESNVQNVFIVYVALCINNINVISAFSQISTIPSKLNIP